MNTRVSAVVENCGRILNRGWGIICRGVATETSRRKGVMSKVCIVQWKISRPLNCTHSHSKTNRSMLLVLWGGGCLAAFF